MLTCMVMRICGLALHGLSPLPSAVLKKPQEVASVVALPL